MIMGMMGYAAMTYENGIIYVKYPERFQMTLENVMEHNRQHKALNPGSKIFLCVNMDNLLSMDKEARKFYVQPEIIAQYGGVALYTTQMTPFVIGKMFLNIEKPNVPSKLFKDKLEAENWLKEVIEGKDTSQAKMEGNMVANKVLVRGFNHPNI